MSLYKRSLALVQALPIVYAHNFTTYVDVLQPLITIRQKFVKNKFRLYVFLYACHF